MGARPLHRIIDKEIKRPLAKMMLFGELRNGGMLAITSNKETLVLTATPKEPKTPLLTANTDAVLISDNAV